MTPVPTLSAALCTYNGMPYLPLQLQSMLEQQQPLHEIVICDDGSTDDTWQYLQQLQQQHPQLLRLYKNNSRLGARQNFAQALQRCTGAIIFLADQDDYWLPHKTSRIVEAFAQQPATEVIFSNARLMDHQDRILPTDLWSAIHLSTSVEVNKMQQNDWLRYALTNPALATGACMALRSSVLEKALPLFTPAHYWHDYWLSLLAASRGTLLALPDVLVHFREHGQQQTGTYRHNATAGSLFAQAWAWPTTATLPAATISQPLLAHLAFALQRFELFAPALAKAAANPEALFWCRQYLQQQLQSAKRSYFGGMPWATRKKTLLKHWLKGGEYLRISLAELLQW